MIPSRSHRRATLRPTASTERVAPACALFTTIAFAALLALPLARAAETPGEILKRAFDAAKASLAAGDLSTAEVRYKQTVAIGLRQLAHISLAESQLEPATRDLEEALQLAPDDLALRLDAAAVWFRRGEVKKARQLAQELLRDDPRSSRAYDLLGRIELYRGDFAAATDALKSSVELDFDFETAYFLGLAYLKDKELPAAQDWFRRLQARMEDSAAIHVLFGRAYLIAHYPENALAEFRQAVKLNPKYPRAHGFLGYAYLESFGEEAYPRARAEFERELATRPDDYHSLTLLGICAVTLRDFPAAEAALLHAKRLRPDAPFPYLYLGEVYSQTNRTRQAVEILRKFISLLQPEDAVLRDLSRAYYLLGQSLLRLGRSDEGKQALARSQQYREAKFRYDAKHIFDVKQPSDDGESRPSDRVAALLEAGVPEQTQAANTMLQEGVSAPSAAPVSTPPPQEAAAKQYRAFAAEILASSYNDLGVMRAKEAKFADAAAFFKLAATWKPDLDGLDRNWGLAAYRAEHYTDAVPALVRELAAHPHDAFARQLLGLSYFFTDNYAKAAEVFQPFAPNPPSDPGLLFAWGTSLVRTRQSTDAARIFRLLLEQNAANPEVHFLFGQAYGQQEDYPHALEELQTALRLDPNVSQVHYYAGLVYLRMGQLDAAGNEFRAELHAHPSDSQARYHLAYVLLTQGKTESAVEMLREVVQQKPDYEVARFELGRALLQQGDFGGAIENLEAAKKLKPDRDATYYQLSQAYRRAGRAQEAAAALAVYQKLIEVNRLKRRESLETEKP